VMLALTAPPRPSMFEAFAQYTPLRPPPAPLPSPAFLQASTPTLQASALPAASATSATSAPAVASAAAPGATTANTAPPPVPDPNEGIRLRIEPTFESWHGQVMFTFASDAISRAARANLARLVEPAKNSARVDVIGRTDATGDAQRNERLALGRAIAVRDFFVQRGVVRDKFFTAAIPCHTSDTTCMVEGANRRRVDIGLHRTEQAAAAALPIVTASLHGPQLR
jgi:outer membrane protein OmpA-like peptidoglycan-associated protein